MRPGAAAARNRGARHGTLRCTGRAGAGFDSVGADEYSRGVRGASGRIMNGIHNGMV